MPRSSICAQSRISGMSGRVARSSATKCMIFFWLTDVELSSSSPDQLTSLVAAGRLAVAGRPAACLLNITMHLSSLKGGLAYILMNL